MSTAGASAADAVHQGIDRTRLPRRRRAPQRIAGEREVAVHVPLDVGDRVVLEHGIDAAEQVAAHLGPRKIENELIAREEQGTAFHLQHPVRMRAEEFGRGVHHFRLEPDAEFHAEASHMIDQRLEPIRILSAVDVPVAKTGGVVVAPPEPAVVQHEALDPQLCRRIGLGYQGLKAMVEVISFPGVERHRPRLHGTAGPIDQPTDCASEVLRIARQIEGRALVALTRSQPHFARLEQFAGMDEAAAIVEPVHRNHMIAAPAEVQRRCF